MHTMQLDEVRKLIELVIDSRAKASALPYIRSLDFAIAKLRPSLDPYLAGKLSEAADYAKEASGRVSDKEHWRERMEEAWYVLQSGVSEKSGDLELQ